MIVFAAIAPHPPILLPSVGSADDRQKVKKTLTALVVLAERFAKAKAEAIVISSPHPDWGFAVPLYFLARDFRGKITTIMTDFASPADHFERGENFFKSLDKDRRYAFIASGDLSHCLKADGPYGFNPDGPQFDKALRTYLVKKDIDNLLALDEKFPAAGECGLRSFAFLLGALAASKINWRAEILSYEKPFGVGYLVANFLC